MTNVDDDVPPLEDIPDATNSTSQSVAAAPSVVKYVQPPAPSPTEGATATATPKTETKDKDKGFAGMKKGFLNSSSSTTPKPKSQPKTEEIIEVKKKPVEEPSFFRIIKEPDRKKREQEEEEEEKKKANWVTDDVIKQIHDDEDLAKYFSNPSFMDAVGLFQRNPQEAMAKYGNNKEIMQFFDRMVKLMGKQYSSSNAKTETKSAASVRADAEVNKLLQDDSVRQLLVDPEMMHLMKLMREEPDKAHAMVRTASGPLREKIDRMVQLGLLAPTTGKR